MKTKKKDQDNNEGIIDFSDKLNNFCFSVKQINNLAKNLKQLKVSRNLRQKVLKCYQVLNHGIQDSVLFHFYIDFLPWMRRFYYFIKKDLKLDYNVTIIEKKLQLFLVAFDEAYRNRTFNSYLFEDIYEYSLDYNSGLQQLLSIYNSCIHILSRSYYSLNNTTFEYKKKLRFLTNINLNVTESNAVAINFHVNDLTSPELIFTVLHKELFNELISKQLDNNINFKNIYEIIKFDKIENKNAIRNIVIDCIRFVYTFGFDFALYEYWFWTFNLQNTQLYNKNGLFDQTFFINELQRILTVKQLMSLFTIINHELTCPIPEMFLYWDRHYNYTKKNIEDLYTNNFPTIKFIDSFELLIKTINIENYYDDNNKLVKIKEFNNYYNLNNYCKTYSDYNNVTQKDQTKWIYSWYKLVDKKIIDDEISILAIYNFCNNNIVKENKYPYWLALETTIYVYLKKLKTILGHKIELLRRDLDTGEPIPNFIKFEGKEDAFYKVDPQGGIFIVNSESNNYIQYTKLKNEVIESLWDLSLKWKKSYLMEKFNKNDTENEQKS